MAPRPGCPPPDCPPLRWTAALQRDSAETPALQRDSVPTVALHEERLEADEENTIEYLHTGKVWKQTNRIPERVQLVEWLHAQIVRLAVAHH